MLASFSIVPVGSGEELKTAVAEAVDIVDRSGLSYAVGAMNTTVEGEEHEVLSLILACHHAVRKKVRRVLTTITIDDREGAERRLSGKVDDVEGVLGRRLHRG
jgi:uncharacterized protein (TIGR00106 family)